MLHFRWFSQFSSPHHSKQNFCCLIQNFCCLIQCRSMKYSNKRAYAMYSYICKSNQVKINLALCRLKTCVLFFFKTYVLFLSTFFFHADSKPTLFFLFLLACCHLSMFVCNHSFFLVHCSFISCPPTRLDKRLVYIVPTACRQLSSNKFVTLHVIQSKTYVYIWNF